MDDQSICRDYSAYGSVAQNPRFCAWVMCGTVVIWQIIYSEGENTGSVYCFQFYNKGILLKFPSSFSSSVVEKFRLLTAPPQHPVSSQIFIILFIGSPPALWAVVVAVTQPRGWGMPTHKQHGASS